MSAFLSFIAATFVTIPLLGYLIIFIVSKQVTKQHRRSVHLALDVSTVLFIISVHFLIVTIWEKSFLWLILLMMSSIGIVVVLAHWKLKQEVDFQKVFRGFWRVNFLLFFSAYMVLIIIGIIQSVTNSIS
ncbi:DUF3397 domain-containing protein [Bacillus dakarensis]|uniref:DUF3397 domain-containing protein n=1 Tax=Robertmurraya dakarensis TaxID=1926278 RepID=UPI000981DDDB|nr:DUF3397 domain-containing protein [Bacillus dakarensis]